MATAITIDHTNAPYFRSHRILQFEIVYEKEKLTDLMTSIPSRDKNKLSAPSFNQVGSGWVITDCTDIEIITPG